MRKCKESNRKPSNRTISKLLKPSIKVYVYLSDDSVQNDFMKLAEQEGFTFGDGARPTKRKAEEIMAINDDKTINYLGFVGRLAFKSATHIGNRKLDKIDFKSYLNGDQRFVYRHIKQVL